MSVKNDHTPNDWENPQLLQRNRLRSRAYFIPFQDEQLALTYEPGNSTALQLLNGTWHFQYAPTPALAPDGVREGGQREVRQGDGVRDAAAGSQGHPGDLGVPVPPVRRVRLLGCPRHRVDVHRGARRRPDHPDLSPDGDRHGGGLFRGRRRFPGRRDGRREPADRPRAADENEQ